jgi:predicted PurR-regulated permease PerM
MFSWLSSKGKTQVSLSPSIIVFAVSFLCLLYFLFLIRNIVMLLFLSFILMVALNPAVDRLQKYLRIPRGIGIVVVYVLFFALIASVTALVLPPLTSEVIRLIGTIDLPYLQDLLSNFFQFSNLELGSLVTQFTGSINFLVSAITGTFTSIFTFITLFIMSFYLMLDRPNLHRKIVWFTKDNRHLSRAEEFVNDLEVQLGGWVRGEVILMTSISLMTYFGLSLLKVPFALPLAILAGFLEILPNLGPIISAVPAIIFAYLIQGPGMALAVVGLYLVIQQLENNLLVPRIMRVNAHVNPLISMLCILIGLQLYGIVGGLLAIPLYITLRAIYSASRKYSV